MHPALLAFVRSEAAAEKRLQVKAWAKAWAKKRAKVWAIDHADADKLSFSVNEVRCSDPGCPDVETIILVMAEGRPTCCVRIALPLVDIGRAPVERALTDALA